MKLYVNLDNLTSFKNDRRCLKLILKEQVKPIDANTTVKLCGYFKPQDVCAKMIVTRIAVGIHM